MASLSEILAAKQSSIPLTKTDDIEVLIDSYDLLQEQQKDNKEQLIEYNNTKAQHITVPQSLNAHPNALYVLLLLLHKARSEDVYINYFEGGQWLAKWLCPMPIIEFNKDVHISIFLRSYEINIVSTITGLHPNNLIPTLEKVIRDEYEYRTGRSN